LIALTGWLYIFFTSGLKYVAGGLALIGAGLIAFLLWRKFSSSEMSAPIPTART
jgi:hypothetical protein